MPVTIRTARDGDAPGIARVHIDSWRTTYQGLVPDDYLAALDYTAREQRWLRSIAFAKANPYFIYVAEDESGRIVGFVDGGKSRGEVAGFEAELFAIYLLQDQQGSGTGRKLMQALGARLLEAGFQSLMLWVMEGNPAERFYQRMGGTQAGSKQDEMGGRPFVEYAYGWSDLRTLSG